jgi:lipoprotein-anchoring transpeptidase ErfK/SrfK
MGSSAWRAPAARAAVAAALVAVAATVLVGLGHADEDSQAGAAEGPSALPVLASPRPAQADETPARSARESEDARTAAPTSTRTTDPTTDTPATERERDETPERIRMAAPRPAAAEETARPARTEAPPTTAAAPTRHAAAAAAPQGGGAVDGGGPAVVAGTPCTATARACVDLDGRRAWLIDGGKVVRGPVTIRHGDTADPTPKGTFHVQWKAEQYTSREYLTQMPYSVFFADGGIAFHEGTQDTPSAGCVKLEHEDAKAWFAFLQVGDEVQIH